MQAWSAIISLDAKVGQAVDQNMLRVSSVQQKTRSM